VHEDGLGPSRLICFTELLRLFPSGFHVFVPERAAAFVLSSTASAAVREQVSRAVAACDQHADVPMGTEGYGHDTLGRCLKAAGECA
jgi:hypothetical protein